MTPPTRRQFLLAGVGLAGAGALAACASPGGGGHPVGDLPSAVPLTPTAGQRVASATLTPQPATIDLGGVTARTWAYGDSVPGKIIRATAGDLVRVTVDNRLPTQTSVHWHGIRLRNAADGVPGVTQQPIAVGARYLYEFTAPDPGTYFFHPHTGVQIDRGLYAPLVIDDPHEKGAYDAEWIVVLDDWTDGVGTSPDDILAGLRAQNGAVSTGMSMGGMDHSMGGMMGSSPLGDAGDIDYPHYLINGRVATAPSVFPAKPKQRVRIRLINAGADTIFRVALGGHTMTVTHSDGYPVAPADATALYIAMGERYDVTVTLEDGVFPLVAAAEGKRGQAMALVRSGAGAAPRPTTRPAELDGPVLLGTSLRAADVARLPEARPDATTDIQLNGQMTPYAWGINGRTFGQDTPISVTGGQRLRMRMTNMTTMAHPMHIHGHTWSLPGSGGLRKDTVLVPPMRAIEADLQADNPGAWAYHCHNIYHAEIGMMTTLRYT